MWLRGVDVSKFQGRVDWHAVAESDIAFAYIREGESNWQTPDDRWVENWKGAHDAGVPCGPYHPPHSGASGRDQARILRDRCADWTIGRDLRPAIDLEVTGRYILHVAEEMAEEILGLFGVLPIIYTGSFFADGIGLDRSSILARCPLWIAAYTAPGLPRLPKAWDRWTSWQWTGNGRCAGIAMEVDLDAVRTAEDLAELYGAPPPTLRSAEPPRATADDPAPLTTAAQNAQESTPCPR